MQSTGLNLKLNVPTETALPPPIAPQLPDFEKIFAEKVAEKVGKWMKAWGWQSYPSGTTLRQGIFYFLSERDEFEAREALVVGACILKNEKLPLLANFYKQRETDDLNSISQGITFVLNKATFLLDRSIDSLSDQEKLTWRDPPLWQVTALPYRALKRYGRYTTEICACLRQNADNLEQNLLTMQKQSLKNLKMGRKNAANIICYDKCKIPREEEQKQLIACYRLASKLLSERYPLLQQEFKKVYQQPNVLHIGQLMQTVSAFRAFLTRCLQCCEEQTEENIQSMTASIDALQRSQNLDAELIRLKTLKKSLETMNIRRSIFNSKMNEQLCKIDQVLELLKHNPKGLNLEDILKKSNMPIKEMLPEENPPLQPVKERNSNSDGLDTNSLVILLNHAINEFREALLHKAA